MKKAYIYCISVKKTRDKNLYVAVNKKNDFKGAKNPERIVCSFQKTSIFKIVIFRNKSEKYA